MSIKIESYHIQTVCGELSSFGDKLPFLNVSELKEFNTIGNTGKNSKGEETSRVEYLDSLKKGTFTIVQTKYDKGDFVEKFVVTRAYIEEAPSLSELIFGAD